MTALTFSLSPLSLNNQAPSLINRMTSEFALDFREGVDINLGIGYVNDKTIPVEEIEKAYHYVIDHQNKYRNALNYGSAEGSPNLRQSIRHFYERNAIGNLSCSQLDKFKITIGVNGATSLLDGFSDILAPGFVITGDPYYYSYIENLERKGFEIIYVKTDNNGIIPNEIEKAINNIDINKIAYFYIITVNNPDTIILSNERRKRIVELANKLSDKAGKLIPVIFDKAYEDIIHNPEVSKPDSPLQYNERGNVFEIGTMSKLLAPALRIGYMISQDNEIRRQMVQRISDIGFSNSLINQEITSRLLDGGIDKHKAIVNKAYRRKATEIKDLLKNGIGEFVEDIKGGDASFYFYITFKDILTCPDSDFQKYLSRTSGNPEIDGSGTKKPRLIYMPGVACSKQDKAKYQIRLSYGFEDAHVFKRAIQLIREACEYSRRTALGL